MSYSKYKVDLSQKAKKVRTVYDEHIDKTMVFDSAIQKRYYEEYVIPLFKKGQIIDYDLQREYVLLPAFKRKNGKHIRKVSYLADFWLKFKDGHVEVKDVKGSGYLVDSVAKLKRKLMYYYFPELDYQWICYYKGQWVDWDWFMNGRKKKKKTSKEEKKERKDKE